MSSWPTPRLSAREAARRVAARYPGGCGSDYSRERHLMRVAAQELGRPGPLNLTALFVWERMTAEGQHLRRRSRERLKLRVAKECAARRRCGAIYSRWRELFPLHAPYVDNASETLKNFLQAWIGC
jgi:hypothetical protein